MDTIKVQDLIRDRKPVEVHTGYQLEDVKSLGDIECNLTVYPESTGISIRGHIHGEVEFVCDHCGQGFVRPVELTVDEKYVFSHLVEPYGREQQLHEADFYEEIDEDSLLDLKDVVRQLIFIESTFPKTCGRSDCES